MARRFRRRTSRVKGPRYEVSQFSYFTSQLVPALTTVSLPAITAVNLISQAGITAMTVGGVGRPFMAGTRGISVRRLVLSTEYVTVTEVSEAVAFAQVGELLFQDQMNSGSLTTPARLVNPFLGEVGPDLAVNEVTVFPRRILNRRWGLISIGTGNSPRGSLTERSAHDFRMITVKRRAFLPDTDGLWLSAGFTNPSLVAITVAIVWRGAIVWRVVG